MHLIYSSRYHIDIGSHVFPTRKYQLLHDRIRAAYPGLAFVDPEPADWDELALVHTPDYLRKLQTGDFDTAELALLEVPWSPGVVEGFRLMTGGTIRAARAALGAEAKTAFHLGGGFHHAFADHGEGFCLFNDVAVAIRVLEQAHGSARTLVVDLDVHHGNGTARIFDADPLVFTLSLHQEFNYPSFKPRGSLDIGLPDGASDRLYLDRLGPALDQALAHAPRLVFYLAGADPYQDDQLGGLSLSKAGLRERDRTVIRACAIRGLPLVVLLAGGYARRIDDTVDIHYATFEEAKRAV